MSLRDYALGGIGIALAIANPNLKPPVCLKRSLSEELTIFYIEDRFLVHQRLQTVAEVMIIYLTYESKRFYL